ncbi:uncharacterized protein L969DRAFT_15857 [Mixia osmundae IAM 14324]|uniref:uncharacterized protein n=1 Tax=Mixia osmundae (strain CBS 9802 / IAM 14324 / JCM 22182 / KY 12970) TaxID=764103 RepID=UPI0004A55982|nr:uncharacterized protein L969DRAFT_15857 [Mixia osmundae IAM 14324]KEI40498.1 hypothetical protein L969DRAFT_15857 [Mixia osmundae IAM 14324]
MRWLISLCLACITIVAALERNYKIVIEGGASCQYQFKRAESATVIERDFWINTTPTPVVLDLQLHTDDYRVFVLNRDEEPARSVVIHRISATVFPEAVFISFLIRIPLVVDAAFFYEANCCIFEWRIEVDGFYNMRKIEALRAGVWVECNKLPSTSICAPLQESR